MSNPATFTIPGTEIKELSLSDIVVGERFRQDYGDLSELKHSLKTHGLINPITCCLMDGQYRLVAGGRRLEALKQLSTPKCLVRIFTDLVTDLDLRIIELAENIQRKDMTWSEANNLQREIHRLQQEKYGEAKAGGTPSGGPKDPSLMGWRIQDTADMLGISKARVHESIKLADKFEKYAPILGDPKNYKTENDARKAIKTVEESLVRAELVRRAKERGGDLQKTIMDAYHIGDALSVIPGLPDAYYDFIEIDPPYGIDLDDLKKGGDTTNYTEVSSAAYPTFLRNVLEQAYRLLKPNTYSIIWYGISRWHSTIIDIAQSLGFSCNGIPSIWVKAIAQSKSPNTTLANAYETFLVLRKGDPILAHPGRTNVFTYDQVPPVRKHHPTQKPLDLYRDIYTTFSFEGAKCLTPFAGSGAPILAAFMNKRSCEGWDLSPEYKKGFEASIAQAYIDTEVE